MFSFSLARPVKKLGLKTCNSLIDFVWRNYNVFISLLRGKTVRRGPRKGGCGRGPGEVNRGNGEGGEVKKIGLEEKMVRSGAAKMIFYKG